ncbi:TIGR01777 family oxidoreductase [Chitinophagaceae bacterium LB-8]|uniref:TIGR01777 family oxidoreductase n=1 Tax=Paraflavisolibacter caeni TaxID=2982496 RepID=A0A9X2XT09_9BACT|nr:TIGR01777 family oxidoreductase [Paraflavisolibacter caeni]MCU7547757.1 TIGR01777 family oxidoreductase [Paraflavisolibacter caeni]
MATVLISGGTGLIGTVLTKELLGKGYNVIILSREPKQTKDNEERIKYAGWNIKDQAIDKVAIEQADYIVHLAGANVAGSRWTDKGKKEIVDSRVNSSRLLVRALQETKNHVKAVVCASAIGWYGPDPQVPNPQPFVESNKADDSFLGRTCQQWESSIEPVMELGKRLVKLRTGIVLSEEGGAYPEFRKSLQFGSAAILGSGRQVISWIHIDDLVRMYIEAIENENWKGAYNAVAPNPVSNKELVLAIAKESGRFYVPIHVPQLALKVVLGEMSIEVLKSATVSCRKVQETGFQFLFPTIEAAVQNLQKKAS